MAAITINFGSGGSNLASSSGGKPSLAEALRDIADDLAGVKIAALAADGSTDVAAAVAVVTAVADADATYGQPEADLINDIKAKYNASVALTNELKADFNLLRATVTDLRAKITSAGSGYTLLTTKA